MEHIEPQVKRTKKVVTKLSNSGRLITMNKKYLTTESSEDDVMKRGKRKRDTATVGSEIARLKDIHQSMQFKKQKSQNKTLSSDAAEERCENTSKSEDDSSNSIQSINNSINRSNSNVLQFRAMQSTAINSSNVVSSLTVAQDTMSEMVSKPEKSQVTSKNRVHESVPPAKSKSHDPPPAKKVITSQRNVNEAASNSANSNTAFCRPVARIDHDGPSSEISFQQWNTPFSRNGSDHQTENVQDADAIVEIFDIASQARIEQMFKEIQEQNREMIKQNRELLEKLSNIEKGNARITEDRLFEPLQGFPLRTVDEFKHLDSKANKAKRNELYNHLLLLGGSKVRDFLRGALQEIMTDQLVCEFKWIKTADSLQFGNTRVANVLFRAATDCPLFRGPTSKKEFKDEMLDILRVTKQRFRNSVKKSKADKKTTGTDEELILQEIRRLEELAQEERRDESDFEEAFADDELDEDEAYERNN